MINVIDKNYLNDHSNKAKILCGYFIGYSLKPLLFTSNTSIIQNNKILDVTGISQQDYYTFSLKNDIFSNLITGAIHIDENEEHAGNLLL